MNQEKFNFTSNCRKVVQDIVAKTPNTSTLFYGARIDNCLDGALPPFDDLISDLSFIHRLSAQILKEQDVRNAAERVARTLAGATYGSKTDIENLGLGPVFESLKSRQPTTAKLATEKAALLPNIFAPAFLGLLSPELQAKHSVNNSYNAYQTVDSILEIHAAKRSGKIANFTKENSPINDSLRETSTRPLDFLSGRLHSFYAADLLFEGDQLDFLKSHAFKELIRKATLPSKYQYIQAVAKWRGRPLSVNLNAEWKHAKVPHAEVRTCNDCHAAQESRNIYASFDLGSAREWLTAAKNPEKKNEIERWLKPTISALETKYMPPEPYLSHLEQSELKRLRATLKSLRE